MTASELHSVKIGIEIMSIRWNSCRVTVSRTIPSASLYMNTSSYLLYLRIFKFGTCLPVICTCSTRALRPEWLREANCLFVAYGSM